MLKFWNSGKEYVSCDWLEYGMNCTYSGLYHCCMFAHTNSNFMAVSNIKSDGTYNFNEFFKIKEQHRKQHRNGKIIDRCLGCPNLRKSEWKKKFKIEHLAIATNTVCNSDCIYCYTHKNKAYYNTVSDIPFLSYLNSCFKKKYISENISVLFGGGEPTLNKEFEDMLELFLSHSFGKIKIYSSGIKYSNAIEKCLQTGKCELVITPDSGDRELYKKIKNVDKFDEVWANICKYSAAQRNNQYQVRLKYILLPGINDNIADINKFFLKVAESNVKYIKPEIEMSAYQRIANNEPELKRFFYLLKYMENYADNHGISHGVAGNFYCAVETHKTLYDSINV